MVQLQGCVLYVYSQLGLTWQVYCFACNDVAMVAFAD
jgi:hypothetical protein